MNLSQDASFSPCTAKYVSTPHAVKLNQDGLGLFVYLNYYAGLLTACLSQALFKTAFDSCHAMSTKHWDEG